MTNPQPSIDGLRLVQHQNPKVYLVDNGLARWIPNFATYEAVFRNTDNIHPTTFLPEIGSDLPMYATIFIYPNDPKVYLLDEQDGKQVKRWITGPAVMTRYDFKGPVVFPAVDIPDGTPITNPSL